MFEGLLPTNINVYATTAANSDQSSYGTYCGADATVDGKALNTCLGDTYSVMWMEDSDKDEFFDTRTLDSQFDVVKAETDKSEVCKFGDADAMGDELISEYQANGSEKKSESPLRKKGKFVKPVGSVSSREIGTTVAHRESVDLKFVKSLTSGVNALESMPLEEMMERLTLPLDRVHQFPCYKNAVNHFMDTCGFESYSLKYARVLAVACGMDEISNNVLNVVKKACA